jgi:flagellar biogenesis protein FliO
MKKVMVYSLLALSFSAAAHAKMVRIDSNPTKGNKAYLVNQASLDGGDKGGSYYQEMMEATKKEASNTSASTSSKASSKQLTSTSSKKVIPIYDGPADGSDLGPPSDEQQDKAPPPIKKSPPMKDDAGKKLKKKLEEDKKSLDVKEDDKFYPLPSSKKSSRFGMAQTKPKSPSPSPLTMPHQEHFTKTLSILVGLLVLVFLTVWLFRRLSFGKFPSSRGSSGSIQILSRRPISPKTMLYVIEADGKKTLIAESQLEVKTLAQLNKEKDQPDL